MLRSHLYTLYQCFRIRLIKCALEVHLFSCSHLTQPSAISVTPATQKQRGCQQVPRLPHKSNRYVSKRPATQKPHRPRVPHQSATPPQKFHFFSRDMANMLCDTVLYTQKQRAETNWRLHSARDCWSKQIGLIGHQKTTKKEGSAEATTRSSPSQNCVSSFHQREATANGAFQACRNPKKQGCHV